MRSHKTFTVGKSGVALGLAFEAGVIAFWGRSAQAQAQGVQARARSLADRLKDSFISAYTAFTESDGSFEELLVAVVRDPSFIERRK